MKITYDKRADAMYIALKEIKPKGVKKTVPLNADILVDLDENKKIIGIEILNASKNISEKSLETAIAIA